MTNAARERALRTLRLRRTDPLTALVEELRAAPSGGPFEAAARRLFDALHPEVRRYLSSRAQSDCLDDCIVAALQSVFTALAKVRIQVEDEGPDLLPWVFVIAQRTAAQHARNNARITRNRLAISRSPLRVVAASSPHERVASRVLAERLLTALYQNNHLLYWAFVTRYLSGAWPPVPDTREPLPRDAWVGSDRRPTEGAGLLFALIGSAWRGAADPRKRAQNFEKAVSRAVAQLNEIARCELDEQELADLIQEMR